MGVYNDYVNLWRFEAELRDTRHRIRLLETKSRRDLLKEARAREARLRKLIEREKKTLRRAYESWPAKNPRKGSAEELRQVLSREMRR